MLAYTLFALFILSCAVLIVVILLQPGKADAGALFTSSVSSTAFGPRGTQNILAKVTIGAAIAFMLIALTLSLPGVNGTHSVLQSESVPVASPSPKPSVAPATIPATIASPSPTASVAADANKKPASTPAASPAAKASPKASPKTSPK
ncbi:MAG: protein translocase, SecG subunit [Acidobacteria bacterium]|nr:protein translocase, SecG subunit [Acidobacteriota bacterium]